RQGNPQHSPPVVADRYKNVRIQPACERLRIDTKLGVNPAQTLFIQKDAAVPRPLIEPIAPPPWRTEPDKQLLPFKRRIVLPVLGFNPSALFLRHGHPVVRAAIAAGMAIVILNDRQTADGKRHRSSGKCSSCTLYQ